MVKPAAPKPVERGIAYWMERVIAERDKARQSFDVDAPQAQSLDAFPDGRAAHAEFLRQPFAGMQPE